jgi:hypothetical protein
MSLSSVFNIPVRIVTVKPAGRTFGPTPTGEDEAAAGGGGEEVRGSVGAFITVQTLVSFSGATGAIGLLWSAIKALDVVPAAWDIYLGMALSFVIGMLIYYINISDPSAAQGRRDRIIGLVIAVLNTLVLFNATRSIIGT